MTVNSRSGTDRLPDFSFYEWYNLFCSLSETKAHLRIKTQAFKHKHFRAWTWMSFFSLGPKQKRYATKIHLLAKKKKRYQSYIVADIRPEKINVPFCRVERSEDFRSLFPCFPTVFTFKRKLRKHSAFKERLLRPSAKLKVLPPQYVFGFLTWQIPRADHKAQMTGSSQPQSSAHRLFITYLPPRTTTSLSQPGRLAASYSRSASAVTWWPGRWSDTSRGPRNMLQVPAG